MFQMSISSLSIILLLSADYLKVTFSVLLSVWVGFSFYILTTVIKQHYTLQFVFLLCIRSAGKSNLSGAALVSRLGEGCSRWPPASLQVLQQLWSEQGALVHTQQEAQAMLGIGQVVCLSSLWDGRPGQIHYTSPNVV